MYCTAYSAVLTGITSQLIRVETDVSQGLPYFEMVGYLSAEVKEAKERVKTAVRNAGFRLSPNKIIVNLSPANLKKSGTGYDLAIALSVLCGYGIIPAENLKDTVIAGELSLNGQVRGINGILPIVIRAQQEGFKRCLIPKDNVLEGAVVKNIQVYGIAHLQEAVDFLSGKENIQPVEVNWSHLKDDNDYQNLYDFQNISGQHALKRSLEVAVAGRHNILMIGPPGSGKSMAAKCIPSIMPSMTYEESLEISSVFSIAGLLGNNHSLLTKRPFRSPHHTITVTAMAGGGNPPKPGEMSLAHEGVLFLDELPEFRMNALEAMRQPLENHYIDIHREKGSSTYPADFMLVAAMNPCRCGFYPDIRKCQCTPLQIKRYFGKLSRPLMDRIDMSIEVHPVRSEFLNDGEEETSEIIRQRIEAAREIQLNRYALTEYQYNGQLNGKDVQYYCALNDNEQQFMREIYDRFELSTRSYHKILKVARTIADLQASEEITHEHLTEALFYKSFDRSYWGEEYGK